MVESLQPVEVSKRLGDPARKILLLDVREPDERAAARIDPSMHIPMNDVPSRLRELPHDRELVVYCHHGTRSAMVAGFLEQRGFRSVGNLTGGIDAWSADVDPSVPRYT
ncbi:MAG TPA: rhodanese-like domain-containing protein [Thermoplasmata archaeon]|nr:rhodanese-like domain-containing protein [Thermoplasmata archaeon]